MRYPGRLQPGVLLARRKRFFADVRLDDGREVVAHLANTGRMTGCWEAGAPCRVSYSDDPKRKLKFAWKLVELDTGFAGIDTGVPNRVVKEGLAAGQIPELAAYTTVRPEQKYGTNSRIDFLLSEPGLPDAYVEVKNVHLMRQPGLAEFPDSVTARGAKHLADLAAEAERGNRAVMLYVVQMEGPERFDLARDIDPAYAAAFDDATARGVEVLVWRCMITTNRITLDRPIANVAGQGSTP